MVCVEAVCVLWCVLLPGLGSGGSESGGSESGGYTGYTVCTMLPCTSPCLYSLSHHQHHQHHCVLPPHTYTPPDRLETTPPDNAPLPFQDSERKLGSVFCPDTVAAWRAHTKEARAKNIVYTMRSHLGFSQQGRV